MMENILDKFKKFCSRSKAKYSELYERIKENKKFLSGDQWDKDDGKFISGARNRLTVNIIGNQVHSVANQYAAFPFTWFTGNQEIDAKIDEFFDVDSNRFASEEAVLDSCSFGLGVLALGSEQDVNGEEVPVVYSVSDIDRVMLDPDSVDLDGGDAMEGALVDYRSREWIRVHMGSQYLPGDHDKMITTAAGCSELVPIITYYVLDTDGCHVYTFVNEKRVDEEEQVIPIHRIPLFPVWGERSWDGEKKTYCGLVSKSKQIQRVVNYAFTQLGERLALSPKPQWQGYSESFKNLDQYYKNAGSGINPILPANRLANDKETILELPKRLDNTVQFGDIQGIVQSSLDMLTSITGVDSKGLADTATDVTATAANYTAKVFQNNVRHYFSHLRTSFKAVGDTVMQLWGYSGVKVDVTQGPENYMELQVARQEIAALMPSAEPNQKRALINGILRTHPDNEILAQLYGELNSIPAPSAMEAQMQQVIDQMKQAIDQKDQEILQLHSQVDAYEKSESQFNKSLLVELLKMKMKHEQDMESEAFKASLEQGVDAEKAAAETAKAQMELEEKAVELEGTKVKTATEIMNAMLGA